jgi:hypothetical protein
VRMTALITNISDIAIPNPVSRVMPRPAPRLARSSIQCNRDLSTP